MDVLVKRFGYDLGTLIYRYYRMADPQLGSISKIYKNGFYQVKLQNSNLGINQYIYLTEHDENIIVRLDEPSTLWITLYHPLWRFEHIKKTIAKLKYVLLPAFVLYLFDTQQSLTTVPNTIELKDYINYFEYFY